MLPKVYLALMNAPAVTALIANRAYRHGAAPQGVTRPYVTWGAPAGDAQVCLDRSDADQFRVQVDVWSDEDTEVEALAEAVRDALEQQAIFVAMVADERDPTTQRFRMAMQFDWIVGRDL